MAVPRRASSGASAKLCHGAPHHPGSPPPTRPEMNHMHGRIPVSLEAPGHVQVLAALPAPPMEE